jgi:hypothetical protein
MRINTHEEYFWFLISVMDHGLDARFLTIRLFDTPQIANHLVPLGAWKAKRNNQSPCD